MNIDEIVLSNIKRHMAARGWSQAELARQAKISKENLNRLFRGHRAISKADILPDIAKALGVSVENLKFMEFADSTKNPEKPVESASKEELLGRLALSLPALNERQLGRVLRLVDLYSKGRGDAVDSEQEPLLSKVVHKG